MLTGILLRKKGKTKTLMIMLIASSLLLIGGILILVK
jgi:hypothetical protein